MVIELNIEYLTSYKNIVTFYKEEVIYGDIYFLNHMGECYSRNGYSVHNAERLVRKNTKLDRLFYGIKT